MISLTYYRFTLSRLQSFNLILDLVSRYTGYYLVLW